MAKRVRTETETPPGLAITWVCTGGTKRTQFNVYTPTVAELEDVATRARVWIDRNTARKKGEEPSDTEPELHGRFPDMENDHYTLTAADVDAWLAWAQNQDVVTSACITMMEAKYNVFTLDGDASGTMDPDWGCLFLAVTDVCKQRNPMAPMRAHVCLVLDCCD